MTESDRLSARVDLTPTAREFQSFGELPADPLDATAFFLVISGDHAGRVFPLTSDVHLIGRSENADIRLDQGSISHAHAKVMFADGRHVLVDLGSTNGTYVNDERVVAEGELQGGDVIRVGETVMSFLVSRTDEEELPMVAISHVPVDNIAPRQAPRSVRGVASSRGIKVRDVSEGMSLRDVVSGAMRTGRFLRRYKDWLLIGIALGALGGAATVRPRPPPGSAVFEIRLTPKPASDPVNQADENAQFFAAAETDWTSPELVRRTLAETMPRAPTDEEVRGARGRLKLESIALATYRGTYLDVTSDHAVDFLRHHEKNYVDFEIDKTLHVMRARADFLKSQLTENEAELSKTEARLKQFKEGHIDGLPDQAREQFSQRLTLKARQSALSAEVERTALALSAAKQKIKDDDPLLQKRVQSTAPYESALVDVKRKLAEARAAGLGDEHPEIERLSKQEKEMEKLLRTTLATSMGALESRADPTLLAMRDRVADLEVARTAASKELGRVSGDLAAIDKVVHQIPEVEEEYSALTRSYAGTKAIHDRLFDRYKASELDLNLERALATTRYQVMSPPSAVRVSPRKVFLTRVALGIFAGLVLVSLGIGIAELRRFVRENAF